MAEGGGRFRGKDARVVYRWLNESEGSSGKSGKEEES
jgi:hypothetical protein